MTEKDLMNESGLMAAIIEKNNIILNQARLLEEKDKQIADQSRLIETANREIFDLKTELIRPNKAAE